MPQHGKQQKRKSTGNDNGATAGIKRHRTCESGVKREPKCTPVAEPSAAASPARAGSSVRNSQPGAALPDEVVKELCAELQCSAHAVRSCVHLLATENKTLEFIARYRRDRTEGMDEDGIAAVSTAVALAKRLSELRRKVESAARAQGAFTTALARELAICSSVEEIDAIHARFKVARAPTLAARARKLGCGPLGEQLACAFLQSAQPPEPPLTLKGWRAKIGELARHRDISSREEAEKIVMHVAAEAIAGDSLVRTLIREHVCKHGILEARVPRSSKTSGRPAAPDAYRDFSQRLSFVKPHQYMALRRAEKEGSLTVRITVDIERVAALCRRQALRDGGDARLRSFAHTALRDGIQRLAIPSASRAARSALARTAEQCAMRVLEANLRARLLQPPRRGVTVLGVDPGHRHGCKVAAVDPRGQCLATEIIQLNDLRTKAQDLVALYGVDVIALGNGTGCRAAEASLRKVAPVCIVDEGGSSVYSTSAIAREEFPHLAPELRSAISIGRRLQDPLSELVRTEITALGVGLYQKDLPESLRSEAAGRAVRAAVCAVGADALTASPELLQHISGLSARQVRALVSFRETQAGKLRTRADLVQVPGIGEVAFANAAGFLFIRNGPEPLDATRIHPECYNVTRRLLEAAGAKPDALASVSERLRAFLRGRGVSLRVDEEHSEGALAHSFTERGGHSEHVASGSSANAKGRAILGITAVTASSVARASHAPKALGLEPPPPALLALARELGATGGRELAGIIAALLRPGDDPRDALPPPPYRRDIASFSSVNLNDIVHGIVRNVVPFGCFVDIGIEQDALLHASEIPGCSDPASVLAVGDTIRARVLLIDVSSKRISLSLRDAGKEA